MDEMTGEVIPVIVMASCASHPLTVVTWQVYVPGPALIVCVVAEVFHKYERPAPAFSVIISLSQMVVSFPMFTVGGATRQVLHICPPVEYPAPRRSGFPPATAFPPPKKKFLVP